MYIEWKTKWIEFSFNYPTIKFGKRPESKYIYIFDVMFKSSVREDFRKAYEEYAKEFPFITAHPIERPGNDL